MEDLMNWPARLLLCSAAAVGLLSGLCALRPAWAERLGLDFWELPRLERENRQGLCEMAEGKELAARAERRMARRREVVQGLRERRLGLTDAAARFGELNAACPGAEGGLRLLYPGASDEERCCRQVIAWVRKDLAQESPEEAARLAGELEAQLDRLLRGGALRPPR
jgi:hypothetical protein